VFILFSQGERFLLTRRGNTRPGFLPTPEVTAFMTTPYHSETVARHWQAAYQHICRSRQKLPANADIWDLRFHWPQRGDEILRRVLGGLYRLSPMQVSGPGAHPVWCAQDGVVLKFLALELAPLLPAHPRCSHSKGHGGAFGSVRQAADWLRRGNTAFVFRTDIRGFYENISKHSLVSLAHQYIHSPALRTLYLEYAHYSVESGGVIRTPAKGICRGCALSPMTAATLLLEADAHFAACCSAEFFYSRFMDDFLFLSSRRWPLRRAISWLHARFERDGFCPHPDKTIIGRIAQGFDWLGVWFSPEGVDISPRARAQFQARQADLRDRFRLRRLPEHIIDEKCQAHRHRWNLWRQALLRRAGYVAA
jgi:hypothetical protein